MMEDAFHGRAVSFEILRATRVLEAIAPLSALPPFKQVIPDNAKVNITFIAEGAFGKIAKLTWKKVIEETGEEEDHAIIMKTVKERSEEASTTLSQEGTVLRRLGDHDSVIGFLGVHVGFLALAMPYYPDGDLFSALYQEQSSLKSRPFYRARIFRDLASALLHCKEHGVLHRDIRPENVYLKPNSDGAVLGDFGSAFLVTKVNNKPQFPREIFICDPFR